MPEPVLAALLVAWALVVAAYDVRQRRVPNWLLGLVAAPALVAQFGFRHGLLGIAPVDALLGFALGFGLPLTGYLSRQLGAGDVKYAGVLGFLTGIAGCAKLLLIAALVLGLMAVVAWGLRQAGRLQRRVPAAVALSTGFLVWMFVEANHGWSRFLAS